MEIRARVAEFLARNPRYKPILFNRETEGVTPMDFRVFGARANSLELAIEDYEWIRLVIQEVYDKLQNMRNQMAQYRDWMQRARMRGPDSVRSVATYLQRRQQQEINKTVEALSGWNDLKEMFEERNRDFLIGRYEIPRRATRAAGSIRSERVSSS